MKAFVTRLRFAQGLLLSAVLGIAAASCAPVPYPGSDHAPATPVDAPTSLAANAGFYQNTLTWSPDPSLKYNVYWGTSASISTSTANRVGGTATPFVHSGLENGVTYHYFVTSVRGDQESVASSEVTAMPLPPAPTGVSVEAGDGQVTVSWNPISTADSYNLYWSNSPGISLATQNRYTGITDSFKAVSALANNVTVYFGISAVENGVEGPISAQIGGTPRGTGAGVPTGVTATPGSASITVSWTDTGADSYNLYWSTSAGVTKGTGTKITSATNPYPHTGLSAGTGYYYVVTAVVSGVESADSAEVSATVLQSGWATKAPMPTAREHLAAATVNGIIYAIGGSPNNGSTKLATVEAYDPATDTWTTKASMPTARLALVAVAVNSIIYAIGGVSTPTSSDCETKVEAYDSATNTWSTKTAMPTGRYAMTGAAIGNYIYVLAGVDTGSDCGAGSIAERYDEVGDTWTSLTSMPSSRNYTAGSAAGGKVYVLGGNEGLTTAEVYDPTGNSWSAAPGMPTARRSLTASTLNGQVYAIGGSLAAPPTNHMIQ